MDDKRQRIINLVRSEVTVALKGHLMDRISDRVCENEIDAITDRFLFLLNDRLHNSLDLGQACEEMGLLLPDGRVSTRCLVAALHTLQKQHDGTAHGHKVQYLANHAEHVFGQRTS